MIWVDYCIIVVALISIITGVLRGFVKEVLSIIVWIAAVIFTWLCHGIAEDALKVHISNPALASAAGYAATFLLGLLIGAIISSLMVEAVRNSRFASADKTLGAGFGLVRALLLVALFVMVAGNMGSKHDKWWNASLIVPPMQPLADGVEKLFPESWLEKIRPAPISTKPAKPER